MTPALCPPLCEWRGCSSVGSGAFNDPGHSAVPPVVFSTSRAMHTRLDFWKRTKHHCSGVEASGNRLPRGRASDEDVACCAVFRRRHDCVERVRHVAECGCGHGFAARPVDLRVGRLALPKRLGSTVSDPAALVQRLPPPRLRRQTSRPSHASDQPSRARPLHPCAGQGAHGASWRRFVPRR